MKTFSTKQEATEYMTAKYSTDFVSMGLVNVIYAGPVIAKMMNVSVGWFVDIEEGK